MGQVEGATQMTHLCVVTCEQRRSHQSFVKLGAPRLGQLYVLKTSAVLSTKAGAVLFTYSIREGTSEFRTSGVLESAQGSVIMPQGPPHLSQTPRQSQGCTTCNVVSKGVQRFSPVRHKRSSLAILCLPATASLHAQLPLGTMLTASRNR